MVESTKANQIDDLKMEVSHSTALLLRLSDYFVFVKFLMRLQQQDYISANQI